jgi:hypothetical protein
VVAMAPPGRQKMKKSSNKVFFAGWIPGINSYTDLRNILQFLRIYGGFSCGRVVVNYHEFNE